MERFASKHLVQISGSRKAVIFQFTHEAVLSGAKSQTSRLWRDNWEMGYNGIGNTPKPYDACYSFSIIETQEGKSLTYRKQYYIGQELSVQTARGTKGIAKIRILELTRRDVRSFDDEDYARETGNYADSRDTLFWLTWLSMHDKPVYRQFSEIQYLSDVLNGRDKKHYDALVIRFELLP